MEYQKPKSYNSTQTEETQSRHEKPRLHPEPKPEPCQHIKFLDCNKPTKRVIFECYHCRQGIIAQLHSNGEIQRLEPPCPNCGKTAIRLEATQVISMTPIPSPWGE
ncbi:hypothetical protein BZZ01_16785 [Nostocales cyanobacterium HT-58-2]|nr:hypothetical protein BZZ01_16785 [Nostocales cyanobacterium HT-58-2]